MSTSYTNPVYGGYFADPYVWECEGVYYAVGTGPAGSDGMRFPLLTSTDLVNWKPLGHALIPVSSDLGDDYWAPEVASSGGKFYLYYSVGHGDKGHHLRVAIADQPQGPYTDMGHPLIDVGACPFSIDAHAFRDDDGEWYLFYARDFLDMENGFCAGTGIAMDRLIGMNRLAGEEKTVVRARSDWQMFMADRMMYDGVYDWHTLEGPAVVKHDGRYYCFYSGCCYQNESYGVDYAVADSVIGEYSDAGNESGPRVLRSLQGKVVGPGHNSIVRASDEEIVVYHAWDVAMTARRMCIDRLEWTTNGPRCVGPTWTPQSLDR